MYSAPDGRGSYPTGLLLLLLAAVRLFHFAAAPFPIVFGSKIRP
jgi:hypothetical protein